MKKESRCNPTAYNRDATFDKQTKQRIDNSYPKNKNRFGAQGLMQLRLPAVSQVEKNNIIDSGVNIHWEARDESARQ